MTVVTIDTFDGGHAEDLRTHATNECAFSRNFDLFTNPHTLIPFPDSIPETLTGDYAMNDIQLSDVGVSLFANNYSFTALGGKTDISTKASFYIKSAINSKWEITASGTTTFIQGSQIIYQGKAYALTYDGTQYSLIRFEGTGSVTLVGSVTGTKFAKPIVCRIDTTLYFAVDNIIVKYDGSTFDDNAKTIADTNLYIASITSYGIYLAVTTQNKSGEGASYCYLWGRDTSSSFLQESIYLGECEAVVVENLDNSLIFVTIPTSFNGTSINPKFEIKRYISGEIVTLKSISLPYLQRPSVYKAKNSNRLYFGCNNDVAVYVVGKNKSGNYIVTQERFYKNGSIIGSGLGNISIIGDIMWTGSWSGEGVYSLDRTRSLADGLAYNSISQYRTTINPSMPIADRISDKKLESVAVLYTGASSGITGLKYSVDGSAFTSIISQTNVTGEHIIKASAENDGNPFMSGNEIQFQIESSGGAQIKEIKYVYSKLSTI